MAASYSVWFCVFLSSSSLIFGRPLKEQGTIVMDYNIIYSIKGTCINVPLHSVLLFIVCLFVCLFVCSFVFLCLALFSLVFRFKSFCILSYIRPVCF